MEITNLSGPACHFLDRLPVELRLQIYAYLVTFSAPLKLRQVIPGSRDLAILRTNKQIHDEAVSVLYELNTIVVTRNDFCPNTDASLRTPLRRAQAHRLHLSAFSISIACTVRGQQSRCAVCRPDASGLWDALRMMPRLRGARVDFRGHGAEFVSLRRASGGALTVVVDEGREDGPGDGEHVCVRLEGAAVRGLDVRGVVRRGEGEAAAAAGWV